MKRLGKVFNSSIHVNDFRLQISKSWKRWDKSNILVLCYSISSMCSTLSNWNKLCSSPEWYQLRRKQTKLHEQTHLNFITPFAVRLFLSVNFLNHQKNEFMWRSLIGHNSTSDQFQYGENFNKSAVNFTTVKMVQIGRKIKNVLVKFIDLITKNAHRRCSNTLCLLNWKRLSLNVGEVAYNQKWITIVVNNYIIRTLINRSVRLINSIIVRIVQRFEYV